MSEAFQIVVVRPTGFIYVESWREAIDALHHGLGELGAAAPIRANQIENGSRPIIFGAHHLAQGDEFRLPTNSIIYNLEQLIPGYPWYNERYLRILQRFSVWDFSLRNIEYMRRDGITQSAMHVPVGYVPQHSRIAPQVEDVDVLFYGLISPRRKAVLDQLAGRGYKVVALNGVFGDERDRWIARAKVVMNIHLNEGGMFEWLRILYLLANRKAVVSENNEEEIDDDILDGVYVARYEELVQTAAELVRDDAKRAVLAERGFRAISIPERRMSRVLKKVLGGVKKRD